MLVSIGGLCFTYSSSSSFNYITFFFSFFGQKPNTEIRTWEIFENDLNFFPPYTLYTQQNTELNYDWIFFTNRFGLVDIFSHKQNKCLNHHYMWYLIYWSVGWLICFVFVIKFCDLWPCFLALKQKNLHLPKANSKKKSIILFEMIEIVVVSWFCLCVLDQGFFRFVFLAKKDSNQKKNENIFIVFNCVRVFDLDFWLVKLIQMFFNFSSKNYSIFFEISKFFIIFFRSIFDDDDHHWRWCFVCLGGKLT